MYNVHKVDMQDVDRTRIYEFAYNCLLDCGCGCVRVWIFGEGVVGVWVSRAVLYIRNCVSRISRKRFVHIVFDKYF